MVKAEKIETKLKKWLNLLRKTWASDVVHQNYYVAHLI